MIIMVPKSPDNTVQKATNLRYVFIDESGDLGRFGNRYFVIAGLVTKDKKPLDRIIKRIRQRRLKKSIKELMEIKAHSADETIRKEVLDKVRQTDVEIYALVLDKNKVFSNLFDVQNRFYNYLVGQMLSRINLGKEKVIINIDKKHTNSFLRDDFLKYIQKRLMEKRDGSTFEIFQLPSESSNALQVVDFVAWAINRKFNSGDDSYYSIIESKTKISLMFDENKK